MSGRHAPAVRRTFRGRRKDRTEVVCEVHGARLEWNGQPAVLETLLDITDRDRAEHVLAESEARLRTILDAEPECVKLLAADGTIIEMNPAGLAMFEADSPDEVVGRKLHSFVTAEHHAALEDLNRRVFAGATDEIEFEAVSVRWIHARGFPVRNLEGQVIRVAGVAEDITERHELKRQLQQTQKMESVGLLAGGVAHDFNNLLTVILGNGELGLAHLQAADPIRPAVAEIVEAGDRAAALTSQLLAFSRRQVLEPRIVNLHALVADTERMLRRLIGEHIELQVIQDPAASWVKVDPNRLTQVVLNLAVNARDAMPQGGRLTIEVSTVVCTGVDARDHVEATPGRYVRVASPEVPPERGSLVHTTAQPGADHRRVSAQTSTRVHVETLSSRTCLVWSSLPKACESLLHPRFAIGANLPKALRLIRRQQPVDLTLQPSLLNREQRHGATEDSPYRISSSCSTSRRS